MQTVIHQLKEKLDLTTVVGESVTLKKRGQSLMGLCPFHSEKTPSFHVFPSKGYFRCFGCQEHGDVLDFLTKSKGVTLAELIHDLAKKYNIHHAQSDDKEDPIYKEREAQYLLNKWAQSVFASQFEKLNQILLAENRPLQPETITHFGIGYCEENAIQRSFASSGHSEADLLKLGLIKRADNGKVYDAFRNRIIFPIRNPQGKVAGFSGRKLASASQSSAKYLNSIASEVFQKSSLFFGLAENLTSIRKQKELILVEGNFDVLAVWESGLHHVIATCGTALTDAHAQEIAKYVEKVTLMFDRDKAGQKASHSAWQLLESYGVFVRVCNLPEGHDPDSWYRNQGAEAFVRYLAEHTQDAVYWLANQASSFTDLSEKQKHLAHINEYLETTPFQHIASDWRSYLAKQSPSLANKPIAKVPENVAFSEEFSDKELNLYAQSGRYWVKSKKGKLYHISNFIMKPKYMLIENSGSSRVFELVNTEGEQTEVSLDGSCWTRADKFSKTILDLGNFVFTGSIVDLKRLVQRYFSGLETGITLETLGYNSENNMYVWANGIYKSGVFYGRKPGTKLITVGEKFYSLPRLTHDQSNFKYHPNSLTISELFSAMGKTFAEDQNGVIAMLYFFTSLFHRVVFTNCHYFPILFCHGIPASGKSTLARTLLSFFGQPQKQINLSASTPTGMYRQSSFLSHSLVWFDEYKNALQPRTIEFLKGLYDGAAHLRGAYTNTNETLTHEVNNGIMISGQDLPTHDPALMSRVILLEFKKKDFSETEREQMKSLIRSLKGGVGNLVSALTEHASFIHDQFDSTHKRAVQLLEADVSRMKTLSNHTRIVENYAVLLAIGLLVSQTYQFNAKWEDMMKESISNAMVRHLESQAGNDDVSQFWEIIERLIDLGTLKHGTHYKVLNSGSISIDTSEDKAELHCPANPVILLRFSTVVYDYLTYYRRLNNRDGLSPQTLSSYLKGSDAYLGNIKSYRFNDKNTSAYAFDLKSLQIQLPDDVL